MMKTKHRLASFLAASLIMVFPACEKTKQANPPQITEKSTKTEGLSTENVHKSPELSTGATMKVRPAALAGQWYSKDARELRTHMERYLSEAPNTIPMNSDIRALVVPHAGHMWSGETAAVGYRTIDPHKIQRIFILCPNHRMRVFGTVSVSVDAFETPLGQVPIDRNLVDTWVQQGIIKVQDDAHRLEHAIEIQLPFIQTLFKDKIPTIVPLIVGEMPEDQIKSLVHGMHQAIGDDDLVIISTDLMHYGENYGYVPFTDPVLPQIRAYDKQTIETIGALNGALFDAYARRMPHAACGLNALRVLSHLFQNKGLKGAELAYDTSGRKSNSDDMSVSYVAMAIVPEDVTVSPKPEDPSYTQSIRDIVMNDNPVSKLAQATAHRIVLQALEAAVDEQATTPYPSDISLGDDPEVFRASYGVFVTLEDQHGHLRGCIGNILPVSPLAQSLWGRAQDAALNDPRFDPVTPEELSTLSIEISVLTPPRPIRHPSEIILGKHGVILKKGVRTSVFLPQVPVEQGWTLEQTLDHLARKAGLPSDAWHQGASLSVFEAQVF